MKKYILSLLCLFIVSITTELYGQDVDSEFIESVELAKTGTTKSVATFLNNGGGQWSLMEGNNFMQRQTYQIREKSQWKIGLVHTQTNLPAEINLQKGVVVINGKETYTILKSNKRRPRVTFFQSKNFEGKSLALNSDESSSNLKDHSGFDDNIASMKIPPELKVIIYQHPGYTGQKIVLYPGEYRLCPMYNRISSIKVDKLLEHEIGAPTVSLYQHTEKEHEERGSGVKQILGEGDWNRDDIDCSDCWSEMVVQEGLTVVLYNKEGFGGSSSDPEASKYDARKKGLVPLGPLGFGDNGKEIRSLSISSSELKLLAVDMGNIIETIPDLKKASSISGSSTNDTSKDVSLTNMITTTDATETVLIDGKEISLGTSVTTTVGSSETTGAVTGVDWSISMTTELTTALNETRSKAESNAMETSAASQILVAPGCIGVTTMVKTPTEYVYNVKWTYQVVDNDGVQVKGKKDVIRYKNVSVIRSYYSDFKGFTYCKDEVVKKMLDNSWQVDRTTDNNLKGTFSKGEDRGNLIWTTAAGTSIEMIPDWETATFNAKGSNDPTGAGKFVFGIEGGKLEYLTDSRGKKFYAEAWGGTTTVSNPTVEETSSPVQTTTVSSTPVDTAPLPAGKKLNASEAQSVTIGAKGSSNQIGDFSLVTAGKWRSVINGKTTQYTELNRGVWGIFLKNNETGQTVVINLHTTKVAKDNANGEELFRVLSSSENIISTSTTTTTTTSTNTTSTPTGLTTEKIQAPTVKYVTVSDNGGSTSIGSFQEVSSKVWVCIINGNSVRFVEMSRDDWSINLKAENDSRMATINLWTRKVMFDGVEKYQVLQSSKM